MKRMKVLLLEDNPSDAAFVRSVLDANEFSVRAVSRVSEAVEVVVQAPFDVALLDMGLPDGAGLDVFRRVRAAAPHLPLVILSGDDDEAVATAAVQAGAQDYLLKGHVSEVALRRALRYAVERQELADRLSASIGELERQRVSVLQMNELKNDLIAVLAHDIKGPLTSIIGFAELLEEGYVEGDAATDAAKTIRTNAQRLATLANDVLALSHVEHGELEIADDRVNLLELLMGVVQQYANVRLTNDTASSPEPFVIGDAERLRQVFDNLIGNAIKYSPQESTVDVTLEQRGDTYAVSVRDRGMGIPEGDVPRLFQRFSRGSNARQAKIAGTGIGLFIVKMIVERHAGSVTVESTVGTGSVFAVILPTADAPIVRRAVRVTIVTGDRELSRFAAFELRGRGHRVRQYGSFEELARVGSLRDGDVVLLEATQGNADAVRALFPRGGLRVIGIGADQETDKYDATLRKPFLLSDLVGVIENDSHEDLIAQYSS